MGASSGLRLWQRKVVVLSVSGGSRWAEETDSKFQKFSLPASLCEYSCNLKNTILNIINNFQQQQQQQQQQRRQYKITTKLYYEVDMKFIYLYRGYTF